MLQSGPRPKRPLATKISDCCDFCAVVSLKRQVFLVLPYLLVLLQ